MNDRVVTARRLPLDEFVPEPLVIPLAVIVREVLVDGVTKMPLAEEDHPVQALILDRAHESPCNKHLSSTRLDDAVLIDMRGVIA